MKNIKKISYVLIVALISTMLPANVVQANATENKIQSKIVDTQLPKLTQPLIDKATPFIKTKAKQNIFYLTKQGYDSLASAEIEIVLDYIEYTNIAIKNDFKTDMSNKTNKAKTLNTENTISRTIVASASTSYITSTYTWWGVQIFFSSQAITDLGYWVGGGSFVEGFLLRAGITLSSAYLGTIILFGGPLTMMMSYLDKGNGVNLNCVLYIPCTITAVGAYVIPYPGYLIRSGSTGYNVTKVQTRLNASGYNCGTADGIFGPKTKTQVIFFQIGRGLMADGIVDSTTWNSLFNVHI
jgi:hypothetical protein